MALPWNPRFGVGPALPRKAFHRSEYHAHDTLLVHALRSGRHVADLADHHISAEVVPVSTLDQLCRREGRGQQFRMGPTRPNSSLIQYEDPIGVDHR